MAKQQGEFLAALLAKGTVKTGDQIPAAAKPFKYSHKGSLAYVGSDKAVMDVPTVGPIFGWGAGAPRNSLHCLSVVLMHGLRPSLAGACATINSTSLPYCCISLFKSYVHGSLAHSPLYTFLPGTSACHIKTASLLLAGSLIWTEIDSFNVTLEVPLLVHSSQTWKGVRRHPDRLGS